MSFEQSIPPKFDMFGCEGFFTGDSRLLFTPLESRAAGIQSAFEVVIQTSACDIWLDQSRPLCPREVESE